MSYTSYGFLALVAAGLIISRMVRPSGKMWVLLGMSLIFMVSAGGYGTLVFWLISTAAGFAAAFLLADNPLEAAGEKRNSGARRKRKKGILLAAAAFQLGLLAYFKYANFPAYTIEAFGELTGREYELQLTERMALAGISFYTLIIIGYDIDVYRGEAEAVSSFPKFSLFTGYFGHFIQGPIDDWNGTGKSLAAPSEVSFGDVQDGCLQILSGLFKKLVISERLAIMVDTVYGDYDSYGGWVLAMAAAAFSLQLYTDFSGCMDLVSGISRLFGVRLAENFRQPFFSQSVAEFWRRWHITLGAFLRKYVYIPLGGNRKGAVRKYINTTVVFLLSGLWHGGKWTFILGTGLLQCVYLMAGAVLAFLAERCFRMVKKEQAGPALRILRRIRTFILITIGFVLFRSDSLTMAWEILTGMLGRSRYPEYGEGIFCSGLGTADFAVLLIGLAVLFFLSWWREKKGEERVIAGEGGRTVACFGILLVILIFGCYGRGFDLSSFIYSRF